MRRRIRPAFTTAAVRSPGDQRLREAPLASTTQRDRSVVGRRLQAEARSFMMLVDRSPGVRRLRAGRLGTTIRRGSLWGARRSNVELPSRNSSDPIAPTIEKKPVTDHNRTELVLTIQITGRCYTSVMRTHRHHARNSVLPSAEDWVRRRSE